MSKMDTYPTQELGKVPTTFASMSGADKSQRENVMEDSLHF